MLTTQYGLERAMEKYRLAWVEDMVSLVLTPNSGKLFPTQLKTPTCTGEDILYA